MNYYKLFISKVVNEVSYRTNNGLVDWNDPTHISILSEVLTEMGLNYDAKKELIASLLGEAEGDDTEEKKFDEPVLNKKITYTDENGEEKENIVGNLLRLDKDHPGNKAAQKALPLDADKKAQVMKSLGDENSPTNDSTPGDGEGDAFGDEFGDAMMEPETGTAFDGDQGEVYRDSLPETDPLKMKPEDVKEE